MINTITLDKIVSGNKQPDTGRSVSVYNYHASDTAGASPNGSKIGDCTEIAGKGQYEINIPESKKVTVTVDGSCLAGNIGIMLDGDVALDNSVDTSAIQDEAVTVEKTDFGEAW